MKPLRHRLQETRKRLGIPWEILERDYILSWLIDFSDFSEFLHSKCAVRGVSFDGPDDFFPETMLHYIERTWGQWLGPLISELPDFAAVIDDLRPKIALLVS